MIIIIIIKKGMCCGYLQMPFWTFFLATALGKGVVKVNFQALFFITLFHNEFFKRVLVPIAGMLTLLTKVFKIVIFLLRVC